MRNAILLLLLVTTTACAGNPKPRDVEAAVAADALGVAARLGEMSDAIGLAVKDGVLSVSDARIMRARLTGVNEKGKELGRYLRGMDSAASEEAKFRYRKLSIDTVAAMRRELRGALQPIQSSVDRHYYIASLGKEIDTTLMVMAGKLGGAQ